MADTYILTFTWPRSDSQTVIVTGTFDNWTSSVHLNRSESGFTGSVAVAWDCKILYKFIIDGDWVTHPELPAEYDSAGNLNNIVHTPPKPVAPQVVEPTTKENANEKVAAAAQVAPSSEPEETKKEVVDEQNKDSNIEIAPVVPVAIQPIFDGSHSNDILPETKPANAETGPSTHSPTPPPAAESATVPTPEVQVSAPSPSTPPRSKTELPAPAPVTPIKTNGQSHGHARTSTGTSTPPSSLAPSTPKTQTTFPSGASPSILEESSPGKYGSLGRPKRASLFGKLKAVFNHDKNKDKKKRLGSESPMRDASPSPSPRKNEK